MQWNCKQIYALRLAFFEERKRHEDKLEKHLKRIRQLDDESFFLDIPSKLPEAYRQSLAEFQRRMAFGVAVEKICTQLQKVVRQEFKEREDFNLKFGPYLPAATKPDLLKMPI